MFEKPKLQEQLENIQQSANVHFDVGDPSLADENRRSEIDQDLASFVNRMFDVIEPSSRFGESDERILRNELSRAQVALRFRRLRRWNTFVEHDEGTVLGVVPAGQREDPIDLPDAREEFGKGLDAIKRILIRIPETVGKDAPQTELKQITRLTASKIAAEHNYSGKDITAICIAVACKEKGITDRIRVARNLKRGAGNYYKDARRKHFVEASWLRSEDGANGFSSHLGRLRKKAERLKVNGATMADSIRKYYQLSPKYPFE